MSRTPEKIDTDGPWCYTERTMPEDVPPRLMPQFVEMARSEDPEVLSRRVDVPQNRIGER